MPKLILPLAAALALAALPLCYAEVEECEATKKFVSGCDPIEPLYQVRIKLMPTHGPITLGYWQSPFPPGMTQAGGNGSCSFKKHYEALYTATTSEISETVAFAGLGTELRFTNQGPRPIKLDFTGSPPAEPLQKGETRKILLTTAADEGHFNAQVPLWRIWQLPEKKNGKVTCAREAKKQKLSVQIVTLKVQTEEAGLWEEATPPALPSTAVPSPLPSPN